MLGANMRPLFRLGGQVNGLRAVPSDKSSPQTTLLEAILARLIWLLESNVSLIPELRNGFLGTGTFAGAPSRILCRVDKGLPMFLVPRR